MTTNSRAVEILATFFYIGKIPLMPGTFGTLAAVPLVFLFGELSPTHYAIALFALILLCVWVADQHESMVQDHDTKDVVIDEVCGFLLTMFWLPHTWQAFVAAFILFRFLDILKPFPISVLDRSVQGGFGTVVDDLVAGLIANLVLQVIYTQTNWLGQQWLPPT